MFGLRPRSGLCFESRSQLIFLSKEQRGSNLMRVHTFKVDPVELTTCLAMPLEMPGHCSSSAFFWKQVTRATWGAMHMPVWGAAVVRVRDVMGVVTSLRDVRSTRRPDASTTRTFAGLRVYGTGFQQSCYTDRVVAGSPQVQAGLSLQGCSQCGGTMGWARAFGEPWTLHAFQS
ncbi:hypothetical protein HJG60_008175 [Phyllostomus discolor]|uniref:Uncharacterized protein n=1 Tax=Phyllostomus discolor TaxID=89673 RepID=A0A833Z1E3_9CHIR|nr:hypothetical protein HJG60_008175 [Phyllostomus discolor]